ncbi:hypothetical protein TRIATDRAFT_90811 [Trichoderma atroviride IMI 206040]|uniref:Uncharacterized protein n=1 Tax=Hypocrea atroviridis (strain ATCC 20476 / IMI 206040) TaxID=452589 RepID=G9NQ14_HYPAI|nr:uncharacterized protein TRIATDRAFT_90811 [Trichoderma atroviride IMI 206040]EHK47166.1 hypothetical protein TRIATDRAFT_90811 [Trichoderma atroviride IMI 206040]
MKVTVTQLLNGCIIVDAGVSLANTSRWKDFVANQGAARGVSLVDNLQPYMVGYIDYITCDSNNYSLIVRMGNKSFEYDYRESICSITHASNIAYNRPTQACENQTITISLSAPGNMSAL